MMTPFQLKKILATSLMLAVACCCFSQNVDLGNLKQTFNKKNALRITGGINATALTYSGNDQSNREALNWYLQGNINISLFGQVNLPLSMNLTNAGSSFQTPTSPNRIGIHPTYKWVTAHIGDVAMSFSPYTLNGHQFTGAGVDLSPKGNFKISAMYGRLQQAVEYDSLNRSSLPAYRRMGYGAKVLYTSPNQKAVLGVTVFSASDKENSLAFKPDSLDVLPQQNLVTSFNASVKPSANLELIAEYAMSAITKDVRDTSEVKQKTKNVLGNFIDAKNSTGYYKAFKIQTNLHIKSTTVGITFEQIDPGYRTLGAYFFANDLQNFTFNFARSVFKGKGNLSTNFGLQRDNLDDSKSGQNSRYIYAANLSYNPSARFFTTFSYNNFTTFMNIRPIFQLINQVNQLQNLDTLNFSQLAQNANLNTNFLLKQNTTQTQNLNINCSYQDAVDKQSGKTTTNGNSKFYNATVAYNLFFVKSELNIMAAFNYSYNTVLQSDYTILGPTLGINTKLFKKAATVGCVASYNQSTSNVATQPKSNVLNLRFNASYTFYKKHNLMCSLTHQSRTVANQGNANSVLGNIGYGFNF